MQKLGRVEYLARQTVVESSVDWQLSAGFDFKPYMALASLELGKRTPEAAIFDPGYFWFGNNKFRDDKEGGHGRVDMYKSIVQSCNTYYYNLANDLGIDAIHDFMKPLGFGQLTGIDLENERRGVLPSQEWKRNNYKNLSSKNGMPVKPFLSALDRDITHSLRCS